ncbi:MAG: hypothetical protein H6581_27755 [Bacteroidia bacterium]|nr:hypothetical protein [Bacteroidia bacterium]
MLSKSRIEEVVREWIHLKEETSHQTPAHGHPTEKSYTLKHIHIPEETPRGWKVKFDYSLYVTTEFTVYPDHPPYEYPCIGELELDQDGFIVAEKAESVW